LDYAFRAKNIRNQPQVNKKVSKKEVIKEYTTEISDRKSQLDAMRRKEGVYLPTEKFAEMEAQLRERGDKI